jgi:hypothetical protein
MKEKTMSGIGNQFLTSVFRIALWVGIGAGIGAVDDSAQKEQHTLPSLSQQDARTAYRNTVALVGFVAGAMELELILGEARGRRKERAAAVLKPT